MSSEKSVPPTIAPKVSVPRPDSGGRPVAGTTTMPGTSPSTAKSTASATSAAPVPPPPPPVQAAEPSEVAGEGKLSSAKTGAMKKAAAALAAAKTAAKKVTAGAPSFSEQEAGSNEPAHDIDDQTVKRVSSATQAPQASQSASPFGQPASPTPTMHYSAAGLAGTAQPAPATSVPRASGDVAGPRRVRLAISRVDPWSVMKLSFLLAFAIGIMTVVAAAVIWYVLDGLGVFTTINDLIRSIVGEESKDPFDILQYVEFSRVLSLATLIAIVNMVLITALSTIVAFLYNITASLVGGVHLTLTDD